MKAQFQILGIIGDPIGHSLSPVLQNAALSQSRLPYLYLPFRVRPKDLGSFVRWARLWGLAGFNVTLPHKEKIMRYLDRISPEAKKIGAVNTVVMKQGLLLGYNTDADGYLRSLRSEASFQPRGKTALVLGAGGAARAIVHSLIRSGAHRVYLANRTPSKARLMKRDFPSVHVVPLTQETFADLFPSIDLLVNATSVGLKGTHFQKIPFGLLKKSAVVSDLVYRPLMTPFLKGAERTGHKIHPGNGMLLYQGAESLRMWTGKRPEIKIMRRVFLDSIER